MSLTLSSAPGFTDLPTSDFNAGNTASDTYMKALSENARFAAVRNEEFWGYYRNGEQVTLPTSPADGYVYSRAELLYVVLSVYWSGSAPNACNGTQSAPAKGATGGGGTLLQFGYDIDQASGNVSCQASYFDGHQHDTNDGIVKVLTLAKRLR